MPTPAAALHLRLHGAKRLPRGGERLVEFHARLLERGLALLEFGILLHQGLALQLQLAPGGLGCLELRLVGLAAGHAPELARGLGDGKRQVAVVMAARLT